MFTSNTFFSGENAKLFPFPVSIPQEQSTKVNRTAAAKCIQRTTSRKGVGNPTKTPNYLTIDGT